MYSVTRRAEGYASALAWVLFAITMVCPTASFEYRPLAVAEPFEGVDPVSAQTIRGVLERYTRSGATVVFSSHVMELVESLCDWVAVLAAGKIRADGPLAEVRGASASLQQAFLELVGAGGRDTGESLDWLGGAR